MHELLSFNTRMLRLGLDKMTATDHFAHKKVGHSKAYWIHPNIPGVAGTENCRQWKINHGQLHVVPSASAIHFLLALFLLAL